MSNEQYFTCNLFDNTNFKVKKEFVVYQEEILQDNGNQFAKSKIEYRCRWEKNSFNKRLPTLIVPIKNNISLLNYTLNNFKTKGLFDLANVVVVDDRSTDPLEEVCKSFNVNYLRVDNKKGFNFSMLNNIPCFLINKLGGKTVLFWNSDLWIDKIDHFKELLNRHKDNNAVISGSKLLYPYESLHEDDSTNIKMHFPHMSGGKYKGTVQFAGARWVMSPHHSFVPIHFGRFWEKDNPRINQDYSTEFVTGALHVINLQWFLKIGGFNPSLSKVFQDVDLCLRALEDQKGVYYFGKNIHFYHDESFNHFSNKDEKKMDKQFLSDEVLFNKIWANKITNIIF